MEGVGKNNGKKSGGKESKSNVWFSLKKSLHCKSEPSDVHDPKSSKKNHNPTNSILTSTRRVGRSGCSRSIANLRDVIHGSKRHSQNPQICSPTPSSIASSEFHNPITHEVIFSNSKCELKLTGAGGGSAFVGTLSPATPGPGGYSTMHYFNNNPSLVRNSSTRKSLSLGERQRERERERCSVLGDGVVDSSKKRFSIEVGSNGCSNFTCHKCGEKFNKWDSLEAHHLSKHAVTELVEGDSSRKIVEIICKTGYLKSESQSIRIERVLKVHNTQKTIARFEEYREMVKIKASKLPKKHPRCLADGNELLRFYGTTVSCSLGLDGSSSLCGSDKCHVCRIIRLASSPRRRLKVESGFSQLQQAKGHFKVSTSTKVMIGL